MMLARLSLALLAVLLTGGSPQQKAGPSQQPAAIGQPGDPVVEAAQVFVGRKLILRATPAGSNLSYNAAGQLQGEAKRTDWTLAGMDLDKVERREDALQLDGTRVAIRYNPDQHTFERHPLKDQHVRILVALPVDARATERALNAIYSTGIDPALQRSLPPYWQHYFLRALAWPPDELAGQTVLPLNTPVTPNLEFPVPEKKPEPDFTSEARQDHVRGTVQLRLTVGVDGLPHRISIRQPLGYGLDQRTVETISRFRFKPGSKDGKPVAMEMLINQEFN